MPRTIEAYQNEDGEIVLHLDTVSAVSLLCVLGYGYTTAPGGLFPVELMRRVDDIGKQVFPFVRDYEAKLGHIEDVLNGEDDK